MIKGIKKAVSGFNTSKGVAHWVEYNPRTNEVRADWDIDLPHYRQSGDWFVLVEASSLEYGDISMKLIRKLVEDFDSEYTRILELRTF